MMSLVQQVGNKFSDFPPKCQQYLLIHRCILVWPPCVKGAAMTAFGTEQTTRDNKYKQSTLHGIVVDSIVCSQNFFL